jgi:hypothetical protein
VVDRRRGADLTLRAPSAPAQRLPALRQVGAAPPLPGIPLIVLTTAALFPEFPDGAGMTNDDIDGLWPAAQLSLVDLFRTRHRSSRTAVSTT